MRLVAGAFYGIYLVAMSAFAALVTILGYEYNLVMTTEWDASLQQSQAASYTLYTTAMLHGVCHTISGRFHDVVLPYQSSSSSLSAHRESIAVKLTEMLMTGNAPPNSITTSWWAALCNRSNFSGLDFAAEDSLLDSLDAIALHVLDCTNTTNCNRTVSYHRTVGVLLLSPTNTTAELASHLHSPLTLDGNVSDYYCVAPDTMGLSSNCSGVASNTLVGVQLTDSCGAASALSCRTNRLLMHRMSFLVAPPPRSNTSNATVDVILLRSAFTEALSSSMMLHVEQCVSAKQLNGDNQNTSANTSILIDIMPRLPSNVWGGTRQDVLGLRDLASLAFVTVLRIQVPYINDRGAIIATTVLATTDPQVSSSAWDVSLPFLSQLQQQATELNVANTTLHVNWDLLNDASFSSASASRVVKEWMASTHANSLIANVSSQADISGDEWIASSPTGAVRGVVLALSGEYDAVVGMVSLGIVVVLPSPALCFSPVIAGNTTPQNSNTLHPSGALTALLVVVWCVATLLALAFSIMTRRMFIRPIEALATKVAKSLDISTWARSGVPPLEAELQRSSLQMQRSSGDGGVGGGVGALVTMMSFVFTGNSKPNERHKGGAEESNPSAVKAMTVGSAATTSEHRAVDLFDSDDDNAAEYDVLSNVTDSSHSSSDSDTSVSAVRGGGQDDGLHISGIGRRAASLASSTNLETKASASSPSWWKRLLPACCCSRMSTSKDEDVIGITATGTSSSRYKFGSHPKVLHAANSEVHRRRSSGRSRDSNKSPADKHRRPGAAGGRGNHHHVVTSQETHELHRSLRKVFRLANTFSKYVPKEVVRDLMAANRSVAQREMHQRLITLLFCDIANFTTFCEVVDPEDIVELLDIYFTKMTSVLLQHGCTIDKYIGDAIMGFWGAPLDYHYQGFSSCCAALHLQYVVHRLRPLFEKFNHDLRVRVGLHRGLAAVGNIGCQARIAYTALGDAVNTAARLEGLNKYFGTRICASQSVLNDIEGAPFAFRSLGCVRVKGKHEPLQVYEVVGARFAATGASAVRRPSGHLTADLAEGSEYSAAAKSCATGMSALTDKFAELNPDSELLVAKKFKTVSDKQLAVLAKLDASVEHFQKMELELAVTTLSNTLRDHLRTLELLEIDVEKLRHQLVHWQGLRIVDPEAFDPCINMSEK